MRARRRTLAATAAACGEAEPSGRGVAPARRSERDLPESTREALDALG